MNLNHHKTIVIVFLCSLLVLLTFSAFQADTEDSDREYMTLLIVSNESGTDMKMYVSVNGEKYNEEKLASEQLQGAFDYNPVLEMLTEYRRGGWHIVANNMTINNKAATNAKVYNYFFLRRAVPEFKK